VIAPERHDGPLTDELAAAVDRLAAAAAAHDGIAPLNDDARLGLQEPLDPPRTHLITRRLTRHVDGTGPTSRPTSRPPDGADVTGYSQVTREAGMITLVVAPNLRRAGLGSALLAEAERTLPPGVTPSGWAHGDLMAARAFAARHSYLPERTLWQLRRDLDTPLPPAPLPEGVRLRAFEPGRDDAAWLRLNATAFAAYPDQGGLGQADLEARMREPWFDREGLLVAEGEDGSLAAFHWTKVHDHTEDDPTPAGEVYVLAVDPGRQGLGLGRSMLVAGLEHLRRQGLRRVLLYVDAANGPAVAVYRRLGFEVYRTDVLYARTVAGPATE